MTIDDIARMPWFDLVPDECIGWRNVSRTQLSLARYSGGITVNGKHYVYNPQADELIRADILKRAVKWQREMDKHAKQEAKQAQKGLF